jgi:hypothetical protein
MASTANSVRPDRGGFSLVLGGPLYQLLLRTHLLAPPVALLRRRIIASILITWVPLAVLTAIEGTFSGGVKVPFPSDLGNTRFFIVLPILIAAEAIVHRRVRAIVDQFHERELVAPEDSFRFDAFMAQAIKLRNSVAAELCLVLLSYTAGHWVWSHYGSLHIATWYTNADGSTRLNLAGNWMAFVSLPIFRFILLRWYFRLFIWYLFLWRVSRLKLKLNALHPDRAGGLGFLSNSIAALTPVLVAQSCLLASQIGNEILHEGATLPNFQFVIAGFGVFLILTVLTPLAFFSTQLIEAKFSVARSYGGVASRYVNEFRRKWLDPAGRPDEPLLGSADIQSLADLSNSFQVVQEMRLFPCVWAAVLRLVVTLAIPLIPLALTMVSFNDIAVRLFKLLL